MPDLAPATTSGARTPRGAVRLNGFVIAGWEDWEVDNNGWQAADSFTIRFAAGLLPPGFDADWFAAQTAITAEIFASATPPDPGNYQPALSDRLILGQVDDIAFDPAHGLLTLTGRDLTARLIDASFSTGYLNQTSSEIATTIAGLNGLTPIVTDTTTRIGTFYSQNHISLTQQRSAWDILTELAGFENFAAYVHGEELHFEPLPQPGEAASYAIEWQPPGVGMAAPAANASALRFERSLTLARGVSVTVQSWHARLGKRFTASWPQAGAAASGASPLAYSFIAAGLTQDQCQQFAQARYRDITQHMVRLSAEMPGDDALDCRTIVTVNGTGTAWDQAYFPDGVRRRMSAAEGYRMTLTAKNIGG